MQPASLQGRVGHGKISYLLEFRSRLVLENRDTSAVNIHPALFIAIHYSLLCYTSEHTTKQFVFSKLTLWRLFTKKANHVAYTANKNKMK